MERYQIRAGQLVMYNGRVARVEKKNPKWIVIQHEDGRRWNTHAFSLELAPEGTEFNLEEAEGLTLGTMVRFIGSKIPDRDIFVVVSTSGGTFRVAKLGGDSGRFYRSVPASELAVVERDRLVEVE